MVKFYMHIAKSQTIVHNLEKVPGTLGLEPFEMAEFLFDFFKPLLSSL
jgi:hypothetical protein